MNNRKRTFAIHIRVTEDEKRRIANHAKKCRLSVSEYLRQLAKGYSPNDIPLAEIFSVCRKIERVIDDCEGKKDDHFKRHLSDTVGELRRICLYTYMPNKEEMWEEFYGNDKDMESNG